MRSIIEQVDEFIEGFFDGRFIAITSDGVGKLIRNDYSIDNIKRINESLKVTFDLIEQYMNDDIGKEKVAKQIFTRVFRLRSNGYIRNNQNSLTELTKYKTENEALIQENIQLRENVKDLTEKIMMLTSPKDEKVGIV